MAIDSTLVPVLEGLAAQGFTTFEAMGAEGARAAMSTFTAFQSPGADVEKVTEVQYGEADDQRLAVYVPHHDGGPLPVVIYVHGGGFVGGDISLIDGIARNLAAELPAIAVAVTYRKSPENVFPAAHDDVLAAVNWVRENIGAHDGDPTRIAVAGDSAGAMLATAVAFSGQDVAALALVYPVVDFLA